MYINYIYLVLFFIIGLILLTIILYKEYWLLFLLLVISIFLNFYMGYRIFGLGITTQKIGMIIALLFLLPLYLSRRYPFSNLKTNITMPLLSLIIVSLLSIIKSRDIQASLQGIITFTLIFLSVHVIFFLINISKPNKIKNVLSFGIILIFIIFFGLSIFQFIQEKKVIGRMTGTFTNPNSLGAMILMVIPVILANIEGGDTKFSRFGYLCLILSLVAIYFTYSRATYLGVIVLLAVIIVGNTIFRRKKSIFKFNKRILIGIVSIAILSLLVYRAIPREFFQKGVERYQSTFLKGGLNIKESSINKRYRATKVAFDYFRRNPFLGIGIKNFKSRTMNIYGVGGLTATENTYLRTLSELGLLGFLSFIFIFVRIFDTLRTNHLYLKDSYLRVLNKYLIYGFISFLFLMMTNDFLDDLRAFWIWVIVAVSLKTIDDKLQETDMSKLEEKSK